MKQIISILFLVLILINQGCDIGKDCGECFSPPPTLLFEIIDDTTGENLFANGTYEASQIKIKNQIDDTDFDFTFINENNYNVIQINSIGWKTEKVTILVSIDNKDIFSLYVNAERLSEDCCTFTRLHEITIENSEFELDLETGIYKIKN